MDEALLENTGLVWDKRSLYSTFAVLKALSDESKNLCILIGTTSDALSSDQDDSDNDYLTESFPELKDFIPPNKPEFKILKNFYYEWSGDFTLINAMNDRLLWEMALSLYSSPCWSICIFSEVPDDDWLEQYLKDWSQCRKRASVTLNTGKIL